MWSADLGIQTNCKCMLNLSQSSVLWVSAIAIIAMSMSICSRHKKMKLMLNLRFKAKSLEIFRCLSYMADEFLSNPSSIWHDSVFSIWFQLVWLGWLMLHIWQQFYLDDLFTPILLHVDIFTSWRLARYEKESEVSDLPFIRSVIGTALNSRTLTLMASWNKLMKNFFMS